MAQGSRTFSNRLAAFTLGQAGAPATITTTRGTSFYDDIMNRAMNAVSLFQLRPSIMITSGKELIQVPVVSKNPQVPAVTRSLALAEISKGMNVSDAIARDPYVDLREYFTAQAGALLAGELRWSFLRALKSLYDRKKDGGLARIGTVNIGDQASLDDLAYRVPAPYRNPGAWLLNLSEAEASAVDTLDYGKYALRRREDLTETAVLDDIALSWYGDWSLLFLRIHDTLTFCYDKHGMKVTGLAFAEVLDDDGLTPFSATTTG